MTAGAPHPTELLPAYALAALEDDERAAVAAHLAGCAACRAELAQLIAVADGLAATVTPVMPPAAARERLMARVSADLTRETGAADSVEAAPRIDPRAGRTAGRDRPGVAMWLAGLASAGAVAAAAVTSWQAAGARQEAAALHAEVTQLQARLRDQTDALAEINPTGQSGAPAPRVTALLGSGAAAAASGQLVYQPSGRAAIALLERLPALEPGRVYQLWLLRGTMPTPAGTFTVDSGGRASVVVRAPERLDSYTGVGLTAEPAPGRATPTGPILASGSLAAT